MAEESTPRVATGYTLVLPPGWVRIPLRSGTNPAIRELLDAKFKRLPRDKVAPYRAEIERRLKQQVIEARRNGGVDFYFPVEMTEIGPLPASFVVSDIRLDPPEHAAGNADPAQVLAAIAADTGLANTGLANTGLANTGLADTGDEPGSRIVDIDGVAGLRTEELTPAPPGAEFRYAARGVKYTLPMPGAEGRWLLVMFATPGAADPSGKLADVLVRLFDAIMGTFRWTEGRMTEGTLNGGIG